MAIRRLRRFVLSPDAHVEPLVPDAVTYLKRKNVKAIYKHVLKCLLTPPVGGKMLAALKKQYKKTRKLAKGAQHLQSILMNNSDTPGVYNRTCETLEMQSKAFAFPLLGFSTV